MTTDLLSTVDTRPSGTRAAGGSERIDTLDILRGVALLGMILIHFSLRVTEEGGGARFSSGYWIAMLLLEQRFWALFAILFGAGFAVQLARSKERRSTFIPLYLRRLAVLAAFGLIAEGLFGYNVLLAYAIWALPLLLIRNWSTKALLVLLLVCATSSSLYAIALASYRVPAVGEEAYKAERTAVVAERRAHQQALAEAEQSSSYATVAAGRFQFMPRRYSQPNFLLPATTFTFFLIGLIGLRLGVFERPRQHQRLIVGLMIFGVLSYAAAWLPRRGLAQLGSPLIPELIVEFAKRGFGLANVVWLVFVYAGVVLLVAAHRREWLRRLDFFAWPGRMAFTAYMAQVALLDLAFSNYAFGLKINPLEALIGAAVLFVVLALGSRWWLVRHRFGPLEWVWRSITYGRAQPLRRIPRTASAMEAQPEMRDADERQWVRAAMKYLFASALLLSACQGGTDEQPGPHGSTVTVLYYDELTLGPIDEPAYLMSLTLVADSNDELTGRLARAWEHSADWRAWTYHLRTDIRWHDGVPVTARDVKFTYDLLQLPEVAVLTPGTAAVTVLDDSTFHVVYGRTMKLPDQWLTFLPRHLLAGEDPARFREWSYFRQPIGNGPYRVVRVVPGVLIEYAAVPDHPLVRPRIERVRFTLGRNAATELLSGNVDVAYPSSSELRLLERDARFRVYLSRPYNPRIVIWNMTPGRLFEDVRVRRAVTMALDRRELFRILHLPDDAPVVDGVFTERGLRHLAGEPAIPFDRDAARRLLAEAGWTDTNGDGVLDRNGRPFRFTLLCGNWQDDERTAVWIQSQLRHVGVHVDIEALEGGAGQQLLATGRVDAYLSYGEALIRNPAFADRMASRLGIRDDQLWKLLEERNETLERGEMTRLERAIAARLHEYVPATYLFPLYGPTVVHRRLQGLSTPDVSDPVTQMTLLWLDE